MYLTLFVQLLLFIAPSLFPVLVSLVPFNPFNYMNFTNLLNGQSLDLAKPVGLELVHGLIYIGISIILMLAAVKLFFTTGKLKRYRRRTMRAYFKFEFIQFMFNKKNIAVYVILLFSPASTH